MPRKIFYDKIGGEQVMSVWWYAVLVVVGVGIVMGVLMFYSAHVDLRQMEAGILYDRVSGCLIENGFLIEEVFDEGNFDLLNYCGLNKELFVDEGSFYLNVGFFDLQENEIRRSIVDGSANFFKECQIQKDSKGKLIEAKNVAKCAEDEEEFLYSSNGNHETGILKILTASNNKGEKVSYKEKDDN